VLALTAELNEPAFNFSPEGDSLNVHEVANIALNTWGSNLKIVLESNQSKLESNTLELDSSLAISKLNWSNRWRQKDAVISTVNWWKSIHENKLSPKEACEVNLKELFAVVSNE
jgi:nucleoside-diphosphate-sugar epimerase